MQTHQSTQFKSQEELIQDIVKNFNYQKVHSVMQHLEWCWFNSVTEDQVPSIGELMLSSVKLLQEAYRNVVLGYAANEYFVASGGFHATAKRYPDGEIILDLKFVVADWQNLSSEETS